MKRLKLCLYGLLMLSAGASAAGKAAFAHPPKESIEIGSGFSYKYITEKIKQSGKAVTFNVQEFSNKRGKKAVQWQKDGNYTVVCSYENPTVSDGPEVYDMREPLTNATYNQGETYLRTCHYKQQEKLKHDPDTVLRKLGYAYRE